MTATEECSHGERVTEFQGLRILPVAAIFGGNASGKTNLFKGLHFAQTLVVQGTPPDALIPVSPFLLDHVDQKSSIFSFDLLADDRIFSLQFEVTQSEVIHERLQETLTDGTAVLYERKGASITFGQHLPDQEFLNFAFKSTRKIGRAHV